MRAVRSLSVEAITRAVLRRGWASSARATTVAQQAGEAGLDGGGGRL